jgi:transcriptional regulator with XRE-family HTH domain
MSNNRFDAEGFYAALDGQRQSRRMTWKQVASAAGVAASTLTRMGQGKRPDVDGLAALVSWSGLDVGDFVRPSEPTSGVAEPLAKITALLRADRNLSGDSAKALESMLKSAYKHMRNERGKT